MIRVIHPSKQWAFYLWCNPVYNSHVIANGYNIKSFSLCMSDMHNAPFETHTLFYFVAPLTLVKHMGGWRFQNCPYHILSPSNISLKFQWWYFEGSSWLWKIFFGNSQNIWSIYLIVVVHGEAVLVKKKACMVTVQ